MPEAEAFARVTVRPAAVLGLARQAGTLAAGACALAWNPAAAPLRDAERAGRPGGVWEPVLTVRAGCVVRP